MTFTKVWKEQIVKPQTRLGIWKPKEELKPREDNNEDCCEKAKVFYKTIFIQSLSDVYIPDKTKPIEIYDKQHAGIANQECKVFKISLEQNANSGWDIAQEVLKFWKECEGNG